MLPLLLILLPIAAGIAAYWLQARDPQWIHKICAAAMGLQLLLLWSLWGDFTQGQQWLYYEQWPWIPHWNIHVTLGIDQLSYPLLGLTAILGLVAVLVSHREVETRRGAYFLNLMLSIAGVFGVFMALDLMLFFFFWELMLVPVYFLIAIWGHEDRHQAAMKFFIYTQFSGLLMLFAILALALLHQSVNGMPSFAADELALMLRDQAAVGDGHSLAYLGWPIMLGFFIAFAVKLPVLPLHNWLPDAHTQAPTAGSILLAGVLLKTGGYGLIRWVLPLFPELSVQFAPVAMTIAVIGIVYAAITALSQPDVKRLIAYTSISHMGFVLLGIYSFNTLALQGAVMQMLAHGLSAAALFMLAGALQQRYHTRQLAAFGGLWSTLPKTGCIALFFILASLGLPGMGNFIGEFLVLLGAFEQHPWFTVLAATGLILAAVYSLYVMQKVFFGPPGKVIVNAPTEGRHQDLDRLEMGYFLSLAALLLWLGLYPAPLLNLVTEFSAYLPTATELMEVSHASHQ